MAERAANGPASGKRLRADGTVIFGHNTNVKVTGAVYHVQTEDRGAGHALIDTTVYFHGHVMHRRTNNYFDLLPLDADREGALKKRLDEQHRTVLEEIRSGVLKLTARPAAFASAPLMLSIDLVNAKSWLAGKRAKLQIAVRHKENGRGVAGAQIAAKIDGAATTVELKTETGKDGRAQLEFDMPRLSSAEPALVIEASDGQAKGYLRFQLRAKPRAPSE